MIPPSGNNPQAGSVPPPLSASEPPVITPPPPPDSNRKSVSVRSAVAILLSLCLGLFLVDAIISLIDDSLILFFGVHLLSLIRGLVFFLTMLTAIVIYGLMGLTPMVPKRWFLPVTLFSPIAALILIPCSIYFYSRIEQVAWGLSLF